MPDSIYRLEMSIGSSVSRGYSVCPQRSEGAEGQGHSLCVCVCVCVYGQLHNLWDPVK